MTLQSVGKQLLNLACLVITLGVASCNQGNINTKYIQYNQPQPINKNLPQVIATTSVLCDLTKQIARDTINLYCLIPPGINPATYQPTAEDIQAIDNAKLILYHGYNFEPNVIEFIKSSENKAPKISVSQLAVTQPQRLSKNGKSYIEPHVWHNVNNTIKMVEVINSSLGKVSPKNQTAYTETSDKLIKELNELHNWVKDTLATIPNKNRKLLTTHEGMIYYVKAYNLPYKGSLPDVRNNNNLTDTKVKNLAKYIQETKVKTVFADNNTNLLSLAPVTNKAKVKLFDRQLYIDGLGKPGSDGETYQQMIDANTRSIVEGLGGSYLKFENNIGR
ncbi:MAG: metal ABC transporter substrate-binding protein [Nostocales cyanobacterium]|nr:MAG: metal ABC transporter substrate-binding protein [Nostocales cyanobacterium]TAF19455.1 MAG: metal ABC transporter substrate-binding protein [Nostocales cyanobacterium]